MRIDRIELMNFRNFESLDLTFGDRTLIVGPNGSGKSTIIDAIAWVLTGHCRGTDARGAGAKGLVRTGADQATVVLHLAGIPPVRRTVLADGGTSTNVKPDILQAKLGLTDAQITACLYSRAFFDLHHADAKDLLFGILDVQIDPALVPELNLTVPVGLADLDQFYQDAFNRRAVAKKTLAGVHVPDPPKVAAIEAGAVADLDLDALRETVKLTRQSWRTVTSQYAQAKAQVDSLDGDRRRWEAAATIDGLADRRKVHQDALDASQAKRADVKAQRDALDGGTDDRDVLDRQKAQAQAVIDRVASHDPAAGCVLDRAVPCLTQAKEFAGLVKAQKTALKDADAKLKKLDQAVRKALELDGSLRELDQAILYHTNQIAKIDDQAAKAGQAADMVAKLKTDLDQARAALADIQAKRDRLDAEVAKLEATLDAATQYQAATSGRTDALARKAALEQEVAALDALVDKLGPKGVRMVALSQALGDFEQAVNAALEPTGFDLGFGNPWMVQVKGRPYDLLSDGEKLTVGVAFQNALAAISGLNLVAVDATETTVGILRQAVTTVLMMSPVDQVLVAIAKGPDEPVPDIDGLQVVRLGPVPVHA